MKTLMLRAFTFGFVLTSASMPAAIAGDGKGGKAAPAADVRAVDDHINDLRNGEIDKKFAALAALRSMGPKAKAAVPDLVIALRHNDPGIQQAAANVLGSIGPDARDALPTIKMLLASSKPDDWFYNHAMLHASVAIAQTIDLETARLLSLNRTPKLGTPLVYAYLDNYAAVLTPHLIKLLDDMDARVRTVAAGAFLEMSKSTKGKDSVLKQLGDKAKPIGPALAKQLDAPDERVALAAANALTHAYPDLGPKAIPLVLKVLKAGKLKEFNAYSAVEILRPISRAAIPSFIEALDEKDSGSRDQIAGVLSQLESSLKPLAQALKHDKALVRAGAARALASMYTSGAPAAGALVEALNDSERMVRLAAADALVWIGTDRQREAVPVLVAVIRDGQDAERKQAVKLLERIGAAAKSAVPELLSLLKNEQYSVRFEAALALVAIDVVSASASVSALIEGAQSTDDHDQHQAAKSLARIGLPAKAAVPVLEKLFNAKYVHARYKAAEAVARIDPSRSEPAIKVIVAVLQDKKHESSMVRMYALESLRMIGPAAASAVPALEEMLKVDGPFHAEVAVTAVRVGGGAAQAAVKFIRVNLAKQPLDEVAYDLYELLPLAGANAILFVPEMRALLEQSKTPFVQEHICETITAIGPDAKALEPQLKALLTKTKRQKTIEAAKNALASIAVEK